MNVYLTVLFFVFGAIIGSFLNVCIVRLPEEKSVITPRSHCLHCRRTIPWHDNIPLFSYIFLKARCRFCGGKIGFRYFAVELLTACAFVLFYRYMGLTWLLGPYLLFVCGLIVATFVDIRHRIIPDEVSLGGIAAGLVLSVALPAMHGTDSYLLSLWRSFLGVLIGGGTLYLIGLAGDFIFKKESMGGGDVKLLGMIGAFLGWMPTLLAFFVACYFGAVAGLVIKWKTGESIFPFGPSLALGALVSLFWGPEILAWIMSGYGLYK